MSYTFTFGGRGNTTPSSEFVSAINAAAAETGMDDFVVINNTTGELVTEYIASDLSNPQFAHTTWTIFSPVRNGVVADIVAHDEPESGHYTLVAAPPVESGDKGYRFLGFDVVTDGTRFYSCGDFVATFNDRQDPSSAFVSPLPRDFDLDTLVTQSHSGKTPEDVRDILPLMLTEDADGNIDAASRLFLVATLYGYNRGRFLVTHADIVDALLAD